MVEKIFELVPFPVDSFLSNSKWECQGSCHFCYPLITISAPKWNLIGQKAFPFSYRLLRIEQSVAMGCVSWQLYWCYTSGKSRGGDGLLRNRASGVWLTFLLVHLIRLADVKYQFYFYLQKVLLCQTSQFAVVCIENIQ